MIIIFFIQSQHILHHLLEQNFYYYSFNCLSMKFQIHLCLIPSKIECGIYLFIHFQEFHFQVERDDLLNFETWFLMRYSIEVLTIWNLPFNCVTMNHKLFLQFRFACHCLYYMRNQFCLLQIMHMKSTVFHPISLTNLFFSLFKLLLDKDPIDFKRNQ